MKLPPAAHEKDIFYCKPMPSIPKCTMVLPSASRKKHIGERYVLDGNKTNHSLRVAGTSSLYKAGVPEKVIQSRTGHCCLESLRLYERVNTTQEMAISRILTGETEKYDESIPLKSDDPAIVEASSKQEEASKSLFPGIQCNNYTVNVFSGQAQQPYIPPVPLSLPYYNYYPFSSVPPLYPAYQ